MPTNHDDEMLEEYDFSQAKRGLVLPQPGKTRMSLWVDTDGYMKPTWLMPRASTGMSLQR
jgi:hypothetical protein